MDGSPTLGRLAFASVGVAAAFAGTAFGHLIASLTVPEASPIIAVGANVIQSTPEPVKQWAIRRFGDDDKIVLLATVGVTTLALAVATGLASRRRPHIALGSIALLGASIIAAAHSSHAVDPSVGPVPGAWLLPGVGAAVVSAAVLLLLRCLALGRSPLPIGWSGTHRPAPPSDGIDRRPPGDEIESPSSHSAIGHRPAGPARRRFLTGVAATAGGSLAVAALGRRLATAPPVGDLSGLHISSPAPDLPVGLDAQVPGITAFRTPTRDFYRVDTALVVPRLDRDRWKLRIDGEVDEPFDLTFDELIGRFDVIERDLTLNCVSNEVRGPYVSSGRWIGVRTRDLLEQAGVRENVDQIFSRSSDGMTISTPIEALVDDRDAMVAIGLDGAALPRERGYPARLLTPGLYGFVGATKWLTGLTATTYAARTAYWTDRGWVTDAPVKTQSRIDTPVASRRSLSESSASAESRGPNGGASNGWRCRSTAVRGARRHSAPPPTSTTGANGSAMSRSTSPGVMICGPGRPTEPVRCRPRTANPRSLRGRRVWRR